MNLLLLLIIGRIIVTIGKFILSPFNDSFKMKILMVMIVYPVLLVSLQLWITDNFIKKNDIENKETPENQSNDESYRLIV